MALSRNTVEDIVQYMDSDIVSRSPLIYKKQSVAPCPWMKVQIKIITEL